jgi:hypothetical protein
MKAGGKRRGGMVLGVFAAAVALSAIALGCGKDETETVAAKTDEPSPVVTQAKPLPIAANASVTGTPVTQTGTQATGSVDSLPPDVQVFAPDSLVTPGQVVEITAQGSSDVTELTLKDGLGQEHPFVYDSDAKGWRVAYRVPIGTRQESIALSVKATNDTHRWKRVWVFLKIQGREGDAEGSGL